MSDVPTEKQEYEAGVRLLTLAGCRVYRLSQARASRQTPGIPDAWIFGPPGLFAWWECKRQGGKLRPEQKEFRAMCQARGIEHICGGVDEVKRTLAKWGLAELTPFRLTPRRAA